jgi:hypothetical protein
MEDGRLFVSVHRSPVLVGGLRTRREPKFNKLDMGLLTAMTLG